MQDIFEPPYTEWTDVLKDNLVARDRRDAILGLERVNAVREQLCQSGIKYSKSIAAAAQRCGVDVVLQDSPSNSAQARIIMAGHQPVIYHPGLLSKVQSLARFTKQSDAIGINIIIDTDEGDAGIIHWPSLERGSLEIKRASIATKGCSLYSEQCVESESVLVEIFESIEVDLRRCTEVYTGGALSIEQTRFAGALYRRLAGEPISIAHAVVRWALMKLPLLELPLSTIVQETEVRYILSEFARDGIRLAETYNKTLDTFRHAHRIANSANPFPNMKYYGDICELPMWRIREGLREPLLYSKGAHLFVGAELKQGSEYLAPRGSITTMVLRGFCSDLFIHGLGGAKYDRFVDQLALKYLGVELPRYVMASRTRYIFPERVAELQRSLELASKVKEITARTESFIGKGIFPEEEESQLLAVVTERATLRKALQQATNSAERSMVAHALNSANSAVRKIVESGSLRSHIESAASNEAALGRWSFREFPFFMYDNRAL